MANSQKQFFLKKERKTNRQGGGQGEEGEENESTVA